MAVGKGYVVMQGNINSRDCTDDAIYMVFKFTLSNSENTCNDILSALKNNSHRLT